MLADTAIQIHKIPIEIIIYLEILAGIFVEQNPTTTAKDLNVSLVVQWKTRYDFVPECFLSTDPGHKTVYAYHLNS